MKVRIVRPEFLPAPSAYAHVVKATGGTTIYIAGQVALDADANLIGEGDVIGQAEQAYANVGIALKAAGAGFADVVKLTIYIVDYKTEYGAPLRRLRERIFPAPNQPVCTVVGVAALGRPGLLIEVDATAVTDS